MDQARNRFHGLFSSQFFRNHNYSEIDFCSSVLYHTSIIVSYDERSDAICYTHGRDSKSNRVHVPEAASRPQVVPLKEVSKQI